MPENLMPNPMLHMDSATIAAPAPQPPEVSFLLGDARVAVMYEQTVHEFAGPTPTGNRDRLKWRDLALTETLLELALSEVKDMKKALMDLGGRETRLGG